MNKIRQVFSTIIGFGVFGFIFYLVFRNDPRFMIVLGVGVGALFLIVLLIGLIGRIRDNIKEKKR
jgi:hypothetical protein